MTNPTGPVRNLPEGDHMSWIARILPQLDEPARFRQIDFSKSAYHKQNNAPRQTVIGLLICPSWPGVAAPISCYAGVHHHREAPIDADNTGVLFLNSRITFDDLRDGAQYTVMAGEKLPQASRDLGWISGTPATLRNMGPAVNANMRPSWATAGSPPWYGISAEPQPPIADAGQDAAAGDKVLDQDGGERDEQAADVFRPHGLVRRRYPRR